MKKNLICIEIIILFILLINFFVVSTVGETKLLLKTEIEENLDINWWPMFRHDASHSGYSTSYGPETDDIQWVYQTGGEILTSPAIVEEKVYFSSSDGYVYCLDLETGRYIWSYKIYNGQTNYLKSSPAVVDGKVYIGSVDSMFHCLDADDGKELWKFKSHDSIDSSPAVIDGKIYFGTGDGFVTCLNADTGDWIWEYGPIGSTISTSSPAIVDGKMYIGSSKYNPGYSDSGILSCFDLDADKEIWKFHLNSNGVWASPAVAYGNVYFVGCIDFDYYLFCLNAADGEKIWEQMIGEKVAANLGSSCPAIYDKKVYIGSVVRKENNTKKYEYVTCFDALTGDLIWNHNIDFPKTNGGSTSPAVADGKVYIIIDHFNVAPIYCLDAYTGEELWEYSTDNWIGSSSPAIADGKLCYGTMWDGIMYCLGNGGNNQPPSSSTIEGVHHGNIYEEYDYTFTCTDPEEEEVYYLIIWGDEEESGNIPFWRGPYKSGEKVTFTHEWDDEGIYIIKCKTKDASFDESDWITFEVSMPRNKIIENNNIFMKFLMYFFK